MLVGLIIPSKGQEVGLGSVSLAPFSHAVSAATLVN
jgi:hypothetical protein